MKKLFTFMTMLFLSGAIFAQLEKSNIVNADDIVPVTKAKSVIDSLRYDGPNSTGIGGVATFGVYAYFPAATLAPHAVANHYILSIKVYVKNVGNVTSTELRLYSDTLTTALLFSQVFTPVEGWNNVQLTTPYAIPTTGNLYIGYYLTTTGGLGQAGCDAGTSPNPNGNWFQQAHWKHLTAIVPSMTNNWNIRAMCGTLNTPLTTCSPLSWAAGSVPLTTTATSGTFTLKNVGGGTVTCSGITGLSAPFTTTLVPASVSLAANITKTFTFTYSPVVVGANNQTVVIATNGGNITITLTGNGSVGIDETQEASVGIFPNPANDILNIVAENITSVDIFNSIGENVGSYGNSHSINISDLSAGTYIVKVITDNKTISRKINIMR